MSINGWYTRTIAALFTNSTTGDWGGDADPDSGIPVLRSTNFRDDGTIDYENIAFRSIATSRLEKRKIKRGNILIEKAGGSVTRPAGRIVFCDQDFEGTASNFVEIVQISDRNIALYIFYLLYWNFQTGRVNKYQQQTTGIVNFKLREYGSESVHLPESTCEQSKISEVLSTIDRGIQDTEMLIAKQESIKIGLMRDLLTRGIDERGILRSEHTHEFKDSPLGRIPLEWCVSTVGEQFTVRKERGRLGLPIMSVVMREGLVERSTMDRRVESALPDEGHALVLAGDIAYNMMRMWQGVLGRASFDCLVSPAYVVLQPRTSIDSRFAEWMFRDARMVHAFRQASRGVVDDRLRLYPQDLFPIALAMPTSRDEQLRIVQRLDAQKGLISSETLALSKLRQLRSGLMQDLLTGRQRVTALLEQQQEAASAS